jgi:serine/threonine-protein kinase
VPLDSGAHLGAYEIVAPLGAGGMGEVYRARDTKLGRDVAIKILPPAFIRDPERVGRFQREAQILASLNHPHIAAIYGIEEAAGSQFLVLELIDGESLDAKLRGLRPGGLGLEETLAIARQIAEALEAAHEKGIIHRDLKPANVALTADGQVKVLDFGLAKAVENESRPELSHSPTLTYAATQVGVVLGTAAYMSPEQAKGRAADKRSDVWSFGCVLFEMLTGKKAFEGEDVSDTLAAVLRGEPDWAALPKKTPPHVRMILGRCLDKDRRQRLADLSVALFLLGDRASEAQTLPGARVARRFQPGAAVVAASAVIAAIAVGTTAWALLRGGSTDSPQVARYTIVPPAAAPLLPQNTDRDVAITPDGRSIVYRAGPAAHLMIRSIDQLEAVPLRNTDNARQPFTSPDGKWVGFFTTTGELKKVAISGGPAVTICLTGTTPRGAVWMADDTIIFSTSDAATGLMRVAAAGGDAKMLTKPDPQRGERGHWWPFVLPGETAVLFTMMPGGAATPDTAQIAVLDLKTKATKVLLRGGGHAVYVGTGHLVYGVQGTLRAVRFDASRLELLGDPVPVVEEVMTTINAAANFAVSRGGTLVYVPGSSTALGVPRSLVWVNREGREEPLKAPARTYMVPRISPDGKRVALEVRDQEGDIWVLDLARDTLTRLTFGPALDGFPVWTPDGKRIIFSSQRDGPYNLYSQASDGSDAAKADRLTKSTDPQYAWSITPDASRLVLTTVRSKTQPDIDIMELTGDRKIESLLQSPAVELNGEVSPDGRWLAYQSSESGVPQIYVRPLQSSGAAGRWQISGTAGTKPAWSRKGNELFYVEGQGMYVVPISTTGQTFTAGMPTKLFEGRYYSGNPYRTYDVSPDGRRFLMIKDVGSSDDRATPFGMVVVEHWFEELKQKLPAR